MKLLSLHINNFGVLKNFDLNFKSDLTSIIKDNGSGKTTLTNFILVILYGTKVDFELVNMYKTWGETSFGGYIEIELDNLNKYRIERIYSSKGKRTFNETLKVIDLKSFNEIKIDELDRPIGENLLGVNFETFKKTCFIEQNFIDFKNNKDTNDSLKDSIHKVVGHIVDIDIYPEIINKIDSDIKLISPKGRADNNEYKKTQKEIKDLKDYILEHNNIESEINEVKNKINNLENRKEELNKNKDIINNSYANLKVINDYNNLKENKAKYEKDISGIKEYFNNIDINEEILNEYENNKNQVTNLIKEQNNNLQNIENTEKENLELFNGYTPNKIDKENINKKEKIYETKINEVKEEFTRNKKFLFSSLVFYALCLISFLSLIFVSNYTYGLIIATILGVIFILTGSVLLFLFCKSKTKKNDVEEIKIEKIIPSIEAIEVIKKCNFNLENLDESIAKFNTNYELFLKNNLVLECFYKNKGDYEAKIKDLEFKIKEFYKHYNFNDTNFNLIDARYNLKELRKLNTELEVCNNKLLNLKNNNENLFSKNENIDLEKLNLESKNNNDELSKINSDLISLKSELNNELMFTYEKVEDNKELIKYKEESLKELEEKTKLLELTKEFFISSYTNLNAKYVKPLTDFINPILKKEDVKGINSFNVNSDFKLTLDTNSGSGLDINLLSKGYLDFVSLILRFALINIIYNKEKPFIILDDSFTNLDESHIKKAIDLLKELSKKYQIIYLTCHKSREII